MISPWHILQSGMKNQMKSSMARPTFQFVVLLQPLFLSIVTYMIFTRSGRADFLHQVVLGTGLMSIWGTIVYSSAGDIERERYLGSLELLMIVPVNFWFINLTKVIANTILGVVSFGLSFFYLLVLFRVQLTLPNPAAFFVGLLASIFAFCMLAQLMAGIFTLSRSAQVLMNCLEYPVYLLCGLMFPISVIPAWLRPISHMLAPTWAVAALRLSLEPVLRVPEFTRAVIWLFALGSAYLIGVQILFRVIDRRTRITGDLGVH